jgi:mRNA interferase ChpB
MGGRAGLRRRADLKRSDIYMVPHDPTFGHELQGRRPGLIVSPDDFNAAPLGGTKTKGIVRCDQPRALDLTTRGARKVEAVPAAVLNEVLARAVTIFE